MGTEIWKSVIGYQGHYEVSNLGRVRSLTRRVQRGEFEMTISGEGLNLTLTRCGYLSVILRLNHSSKGHRVHRLVAQAFLPNPENKPYINHINCNKADNIVANLEWCTPKENTWHSIRMGKMIPAPNKGTSIYNFVCETCGDAFKGKKPTNRFCSRACYGKHKTKVNEESRQLLHR